MPTLAPPKPEPATRDSAHTEIRDTGARAAGAWRGPVPLSTLALWSVLASAGALFLFELGASSFFLDEVYTWYTVRADLAELRFRLVEQEVAPPLYYLLLHAWVKATGADTEAALRLPSALAGIGLVGAVYWLARLLAGRRAGLLAAVLTALSPLVLLFAQQTRAYIFAMLAVTVAVAAAIEGVRRHSTRWLALAAAAGAAGILLHYTSVLVVAPLGAWLLVQGSVPLRTRLVLASALAVPLLAVLPLLAEQMSRGHHDWTEQFARLETGNLLRVLGTPFDGRWNDIPELSRQIGAAMVVDALALLVLADRLRAVRERWLVAAAAAAPIAVVILTSALVHPVAMTRYTAIAAPFVLVALGAVSMRVPRVLAALLVTVSLALSVQGVVGALQPSGHYPDARSTIATAAEHWREGDAIVSVNLLAFPDALTAYAERMLPPEGHRISSHFHIDAAVDAREVLEAVRRGARLWVASDPPLAPADLQRGLERLGYRAVREWRFSGFVGIQLVLSEPAVPRS